MSGIRSCSVRLTSDLRLYQPRVRYIEIGDEGRTRGFIAYSVHFWHACIPSGMMTRSRRRDTILLRLDAIVAPSLADANFPTFLR